MSLIRTTGNRAFITAINSSIVSDVFRFSLVGGPIASRFIKGISLINSNERFSFSKKGKYRVFLGLHADNAFTINLRKNGTIQKTRSIGPFERSLILADIVEIDDFDDYIDFTTPSTVLKRLTLTIVEV